MAKIPQQIIASRIPQRPSQALSLHHARNSLYVMLAHHPFSMPFQTGRLRFHLPHRQNKMIGGSSSSHLLNFAIYSSRKLYLFLCSRSPLILPHRLFFSPLTFAVLFGYIHAFFHISLSPPLSTFDKTPMQEDFEHTPVSVLVRIFLQATSRLFQVSCLLTVLFCLVCNKIGILVAIFFCGAVIAIPKLPTITVANKPTIFNKSNSVA